MHRSRVGVVLIDVPEPDHLAALGFWGAVTGNEPVHEAGDDDDASIVRLSAGVVLEVQRIGAGTPARLHLDIETDDVDAEVARLERLGAARLKEYPGFWQMRDPAGLVFCVIPVQTDDFDDHAVTWD
jgi:hypothetical protein